ncbi:MAG TPA: imidazoleglycerol-phosphate dehydratase HisB [Candidatus Syntrophoarchaeum butanivorans]|uniref:Imidazoleglycerol-phosphate dehydratase n=1 Tax=Candidatus Syntropharchaeum butanivorans TaxID=1839936 RepID=A0A7J2S3A5_9EURY|nr:imidazoleglycerol-phosphate dehydratase HisB [Candidatus Syntrophoarchaeum butanivorans]
MEGQRRSSLKRVTDETEIEIKLTIDGVGDSRINTGIPFFDHLLSSFATHGLFDLEVDASGDLEVDDHHTIEDLAIALGDAMRDALGDCRGIVRFADVAIPMDESYATCAIDIDGRGYVVFNGDFPTEKIGDKVSTENISHFFRTFGARAGINIHASVTGSNSHHMAEALFKALGVALDRATSIDPRKQGRIPSTKGMMDRREGA